MSKQNLSEITQEKRKWNVTQIIDQVLIGPDNERQNGKNVMLAHI